MTNETWDPHTVPVELCMTTEAAREALRNLRHADMVAADTETEILRDEEGKPIPVDFDVDGPGPWRVMSVAARYGHGANATYRAWVLDMKYVDAEALNEVFHGVRPWGWNANFDRNVFGRDGLRVRKWWDGMLFDACLKQGAYFESGSRPWYTSLEVAGAKWLNIKEIEGKDDTRYSYDMVTPLSPEQVRYAADDALVTLKVAEVLLVETKKHRLYDTAVRECNAQSFINGMARNGLPLDVAGYKAIIANAQRRADEAAERIAVATTGKDLLTTVVRWAANRDAASGGEPVAVSDFAVVDKGLALLKDEQLFGEFLAALRAQLATCREQMATLTGSGGLVEDLFSREPRYELPFEPDDETTIRRWISKTAPVFVAEYIASVGGTNKQLVKAHDLDEVYHALTESQAGDVTDALRQLAIVLASYKRYAKIVADYGDVVGTVNLKPDWNINSGDQVKAMLNGFCEAEVAAYTAKKDGYAHPLGKADTVDSDALTLIGGELCAALLTFREHNKTVTTYGDELLKFVHRLTGRVHAKYNQGLVGTGRLASHSPNAQNLSPLAKPYITPNRGEKGIVMRVLVAADLSQAELRFVADMSGDENMLAAFRSGEDLHERTASLMNTIDMKALKANGDRAISELKSFVSGIDRFVAERPDLPAAKLYKELRSKAKAVAFGYAYGLKGASLSKQLTVQGVPTSKEEADELLAKFDVAYPQLAAWMAQRVAFIQSLSEAMKDQSAESGCDFEASWRLHRLYAKANSARKSLKNKLGRKPTMLEVAGELVSDADLAAKLVASGKEATEEVIAATRASQAENIAWALGHYGSAVLATDGSPWSFESRTKGERRRLFQVGTKDWVMAMILLTARSRKRYAVQLREAWVQSWNAEVVAEHEAGLASGKVKGNVKPKTVSLTKLNPVTKRVEPLNREELEKAFESDDMKVSFVSFVLDAYGSLPDPAAARDYLFRHAMADRIRAMGNQYRNHPIQGGVADAVLDAYAAIEDELEERFPGAQMIQSVHDSIVIECDLADAKAVREIVVRHMEACLAAFCPSVPCRADGDIQLSLDDKTIVTDEQVESMLAELALAA